ncbi:MAG: hypothetical protein HYV32_05990 [Candidatus Kerfeldbacteria bacterium]|nr:hypothetical protein [Candidatus Kerfeldbacteria bacterium]
MDERTIGNAKERKTEGSLDERIAPLPKEQREGLAGVFVVLESLVQEGSNAFDSFQMTETGNLALAEGVAPAAEVEERFKERFTARHAA